MTILRYRAPAVGSRVNCNKDLFSEEAIFDVSNESRGVVMPLFMNFRCDEVIGSAMVSGTRTADDGALELMVDIEIEEGVLQSLFPEGSTAPYSVIGCTVPEDSLIQDGDVKIIKKITNPHISLSFSAADDQLETIKPWDDDELL